MIGKPPILKTLFFWSVGGLMIDCVLSFILAGGGGAPGRSAAPGRPSGEEADWAKGRKKMRGRPIGFFRRWHQCLQRALQQSPGGSEDERKAATTGWENVETSHIFLIGAFALIIHWLNTCPNSLQTRATYKTVFIATAFSSLIHLETLTTVQNKPDRNHSSS